MEKRRILFEAPFVKRLLQIVRHRSNLKEVGLCIGWYEDLEHLSNSLDSLALLKNKPKVSVGFEPWAAHNANSKGGRDRLLNVKDRLPIVDFWMNGSLEDIQDVARFHQLDRLNIPLICEGCSELFVETLNNLQSLN